MKQTLFLLCLTLLLFGCNNKVKKHELNYISFSISTDSMKNYMEEAIILLNKMDYGSGASCFWIDGKLHYPAYRSKGFRTIEFKTSNVSFPTLEPLSQDESRKLFELVEVFKSNGISSFGKSSDNIYSFGYKQLELNPHNDHKQSRTLVYLMEDTDTTRYFFQYHVVLDEYENIQLLATKDYDEPKLPMDKESIMKRSEELKKKREQKMKKEQE